MFELPSIFTLAKCFSSLVFSNLCVTFAAAQTVSWTSPIVWGNNEAGSWTKSGSKVTNWIVTYVPNGASPTNRSSQSAGWIDWVYGCGTKTCSNSVSSGRFSFRTPAVGTYQGYLMNNNTNTIVNGPTTISVVLDILPYILMNNLAYSSGSTIVASYVRSGATVTDWIAMFDRSIIAPNVSNTPVFWQYACGGQTVCSTPVAQGQAFPPFIPGLWTIWYFTNGSYTPLDFFDFNMA